MNFLSRFSGPFLSLLRIVSGLLYLEHGTAKLFSFPATEMFAQPPEMGSLMWIAGVLETVGGALLVIGLFTRPTAFVLSGMMAVAYWMAHAPQSMYPIQNQGDAAILFCFVFLYISSVGAGPWSVDAAMKKS
ncbi:MAG: DoxX family protein [Hyphomonadaceae bacterium]